MSKEKCFDQAGPYLQMTLTINFPFFSYLVVWGLAALSGSILFYIQPSFRRE
ncbi:MAG: hypothetical protein AB2693_12520 [Candidatus Thiodiazotropha sp.]